jgi:hypothetical protein
VEFAVFSAEKEGLRRFAPIVPFTALPGQKFDPS